MICHVRAIPSCPGYFVSDTGRVWGPRKELKLQSRPGGYLRFRGGRSRHRPKVMVHHAVAEAFIGPKPPGAWVCHRNDVATDNRMENLYYGNSSSNSRDAFRNGRRSNKGEMGPRAKLTWPQVRAIRHRHALGTATQMELAREYGASKQMVYAIVHHFTWKDTQP